ncbi:hypothetical protein BCN_4684 [Bacillus cereus NC7401]|nr:hypothetical protein BCN_4684 [Bacillus cereus NC7401]
MFSGIPFLLYKVLVLSFFVDKSIYLKNRRYNFMYQNVSYNTKVFSHNEMYM